MSEPPERNSTPKTRRARGPEHEPRRSELLLALGVGSLATYLWMSAISGQAAGDELSAAAPFISSIPTLVAAGLAVLVLTVLNALFIGAETALEILRPMHVRALRETENPKADKLQRLLDRRQDLGAACTLGSHLCRMGMVLGSLAFSPGVALWLGQQTGWEYGLGLLLLGGLAVALPIALISLMIELVPKSYAGLHPVRVSLALDPLIGVFAVLLGPLTKVVTGIASVATRRFGARATFVIANQAEEEIKTLVETAEESGEIEAEEKELLHSVFEFTDTVAREVMTPRVDLDAMPVTSTPDEIMRVIVESGHSRIPLFEETDDQIVGIVHAKDLLQAMMAGQGTTSLRRLMRPALFVPENKGLNELLQEMRVSRSQMAVVQDEFGGTAGIVTIEDIVEELVGDIVDEYDQEEPEVVETERGFLVDGKTHLDDVNHEVGSDFESEEFDTIGGYVFGLFGRQPKQDESVEDSGYRFTIAETDGRRIVRLRVEKLPEDEPVPV